MDKFEVIGRGDDGKYDYPKNIRCKCSRHNLLCVTSGNTISIKCRGCKEIVTLLYNSSSGKFEMVDK